MARPIREMKRADPTTEQLQARALTDLLEAVTEHREAILDTLEILGQLKEMGVLAAARGLLEQRHEVGVIAVQQFNQPRMHHTLKNIMTLMQMMGSIQPEQLQKLLHGVSKGLEAAGETPAGGRVPGLFELAKSAAEPAVRMSLVTMLGMLQGMGESLLDGASPAGGQAEEAGGRNEVTQ